GKVRAVNSAGEGDEHRTHFAKERAQQFFFRRRFVRRRLGDFPAPRLFFNRQAIHRLSSAVSTYLPTRAAVERRTSDGTLRLRPETSFCVLVFKNLPGANVISRPAGRATRSYAHGINRHIESVDGRSRGRVIYSPRTHARSPFVSNFDPTVPRLTIALMLSG